MIQRVLKLAAAMLLVVAVSAPGTALARPTASFKYSPRAPVMVGEVERFDATKSTCDVPPCRYLWSWRYSSGIVGGQMGEGRIIHYAFGQAASGRSVAVVLKVVNSTKTHGFATATLRIAVRPKPALA